VGIRVRPLGLREEKPECIETNNLRGIRRWGLLGSAAGAETRVNVIKFLPNRAHLTIKWAWRLAESHERAAAGDISVT